MGDSVVFSYVSGTSDLHNVPEFAIGANTEDGFLEFTFASFAGCDTITSMPKLMGTFKIENLSYLNPYNHSIEWNFDGVSKTIFTDHNYNDITITENLIAHY